MICGFLVYYNVTSATFASAKLAELLLGTTIAFVCALIAVGADLQESMTTQLSGSLGARANTSILFTWQGWAGLIAWGAFTAAMFHVVLIDPSWASNTFHFKVDDKLPLTGVTIGISALFIIRSKLVKVGNVEWGMEWVYLWSSAQVLTAVNRHRYTTKGYWERKFRPVARDLAGYPGLFTDIETYYVSNILIAKPKKVQDAMTQEFRNIRAKHIPAGDPAPDATINASEPARLYLVSVILDYLGQNELVTWAGVQGIAIT